MTTLMVSQTIFYIVASLAIVVVAILLGVMIYYLICILRNTRDISEDVTHTYKRTKRGIESIINKVMRKNKNHGEEK